MDRIRVAVVNFAGLSTSDVEAGVAALQQQVSQDFAPVWNVDAELSTIPPGARQPGAWGLVLLDSRDYPETTSSGLPLATVPVRDLPAGQDWTFRASHELLEMLASPMIAGTVCRQSGCAGDGRPATFALCAREVCDPCGGWESRYLRGPQGRRRPVSDFVFPAWFRPGGGGDPDGRLDERSQVKAPFEVLAGGWAYVFDLVERTMVALGAGGAPVAPQPPMGRRMQHLADALAVLPRPLRAGEDIWSP